MKTMKTCKYGCGKMKAGGPVKKMKKMQGGGETIEDLRKKDRQILRTTSGKIGVGTTLAGLTAIASKAIADANKKRKAVTDIKKANPGMTRKDARKKLNQNSEEELTKNRRGGSAKKYQIGGVTGGYAKPQKGGDNVKMGIYGVPNAGRTDALGFKKGGSTTSRAVSPGCRGGMVKDASGKCVSERPRFKKGGFPDLNKDGKITRADILKGRGVIKRLGGAKKR
jgi:hypothetical protein